MQEIDRLMGVANRAPSKPGLFDAFELGLPAGCPSPAPGAPPSSVLAADSVPVTADPPRFFETPYGYYDADQLRADAAAGGWDKVQLEDVRFQSASPSVNEFATGFVRGSPLTH